MATEDFQAALPPDVTVYERSVYSEGDSTFALVNDADGIRRLYVEGPAATDFDGGTVQGDGQVFPLTYGNATALADVFPWLEPTTAGRQSAFGFGDRIGLATPGHVRAVRDSGLVPVFAQQSIREMDRTGRSPKDVLATAIFGVFEEGYEGGFVADADHLMAREDVERTAGVGFTMFTCDPSEHVVADADSMSEAAVEDAFADLDDSEAILDRYAGETFEAETDGYTWSDSFSEIELKRAAVKYYAAIEFAEKLYGWVEAAVDGDFDFEVSVDETETPTTHLEHALIASELDRRGVEVTSLAPRFVGSLEKGIDYIGDRDEFEEHLRGHVAIAETYGPYRLSLHSGSDKFSIYPFFEKYASDYQHVKTAGTSYLEAIRVVAEHDPDLYREIHAFALERFEEDKATYHVNTDLSNVPDIDDLADDELPTILEGDDGRQLLHITYGSVLSATDENGEFRFKDDLLATLREYEDDHYAFLEEHLGHHVDLLTGEIED
ncbi:tagaturonate epimerase family protein [Halorhabdus sp. BNX81]|uniref:tagaturonate epimerase family protein n=1 Tax=Halorhabdus sp. BNX81 TaxID=2980181 RepID=UPI0023DD25B9|nr:tagaturonate epimerase family protein [Halorhabdus sp. BNX81]WEL21529.1 Tagaturonate epimerase [Halorhabdus sp. BNX81]